VFAVPDEGPSLVRKFAQYMTCFHIAYSLCHILGALSYIYYYHDTLTIHVQNCR
jgi:hypothetical protein